MYKVVFEFLNPQGRWVEDDLSNNGAGFSLEEADYIAMDFNLLHDETAIQTRNARIVEI